MDLRLLKKVLAAVLLVSASGLAGSKHDVYPSVPAVPAPHGKEALCAITIQYVSGRPTAVQIRYSGESCEGDELALVHALAAILSYQGPQTPL